MPKGGARNRSGPMPDPSSGRSERRGYTLQALPAEGYKGRTPKFPLPPMAEMDPAIAERELAKWKLLWRTPQACAWSLPSEAWRTEVVALYARQFALVEQGIGGASALGQLHRLGDQIGMTTAGLAEMGWRIVDEPQKPIAVGTEGPETREFPEGSNVRRLRGA